MHLDGKSGFNFLRGRGTRWNKGICDQNSRDNNHKKKEKKKKQKKKTKKKKRKEEEERKIQQADTGSGKKKHVPISKDLPTSIDL